MPKDEQLKAAKAGDPISASQWNRMRDGLRQMQGLTSGFVSSAFVVTRPKGGSGSSLQAGEATTAISAAVNWSTPGSGTVQFKNYDGTDDGDPVDIRNLALDGFVLGSIVICDRAYDPPMLVSVFCTEVSA